MVNVKTGTIYLYRNKDDGYDDAENKFGLTGEAARTHAYAGYEIALDVAVDLDTGVTEVTAINGRSLGSPIWL